MITMAHASMYMGLIQTLVYGSSVPSADTVDYNQYLIITVLFVFVPLTSVLVSHFAYSLGNKDLKIINILSGKGKKQ
jgi:hypothetical protein